MVRTRRQMEATVAGRLRRMGWLVVVEGGQGGVAVADGGSNGKLRRRCRMEADGGNGGGWRRRCGDGVGGRGGSRVD